MANSTIFCHFWSIQKILKTWQIFDASTKHSSSLRIIFSTNQASHHGENNVHVPLKMGPYSYISHTIATNVIKRWGGISRPLVSVKPFVSSTSQSKLPQKTPIYEQLFSSSLFNTKWQLWEWQKEFILGGFVGLESGRRSIFNSARWTECKNVCGGFKRTGFDLLSLPPSKPSASPSNTITLSFSFGLSGYAVVLWGY